MICIKAILDVSLQVSGNTSVGASSCLVRASISQLWIVLGCHVRYQPAWLCKALTTPWPLTLKRFLVRCFVLSEVMSIFGNVPTLWRFTLESQRRLWMHSPLVFPQQLRRCERLRALCTTIRKKVLMGSAVRIVCLLCAKPPAAPINGTHESWHVLFCGTVLEKAVARRCNKLATFSRAHKARNSHLLVCIGTAPFFTI